MKNIHGNLDHSFEMLDINTARSPRRTQNLTEDTLQFTTVLTSHVGEGEGERIFCSLQSLDHSPRYHVRDGQRSYSYLRHLRNFGAHGVPPTVRYTENVYASKLVLSRRL